MAYKVFSNGNTLNASELNTFLMNQTVMVFADSAGRTSALPTPTEGMVTFLESDNTLTFWDGAAWAPIYEGAIPKDLLTTAGDLIYASGAGTPVRLGIGTNNQVLTVTAGVPTWETPAGGGAASTWVPMRSGSTYKTPELEAIANHSLTLNTVSYTPIIIPNNCTLDRISVVASSTGTGTGRLGIYSDTSGAPGTLVLDAGTVSMPSAAIYSITISQAVTAGVFWLAYVAQGTTRQVNAIDRSPLMSVDPTSTSVRYYAGFTQTGVSGALPTTPSSLTLAARSTLMTVRVA